MADIFSVCYYNSTDYGQHAEVSLKLHLAMVQFESQYVQLTGGVKSKNTGYIDGCHRPLHGVNAEGS